jgi:hypothetical protein
VLALLMTACGARTDLGAPRPISGSPPVDSGGTPPATIACAAKEKSVLSKGTTTNADVRIDDAFVYWNDGARIVRVPKTGSLTPEVVVDAVVDLGAFDVTTSGVVFAAHGESHVRRSDGAVLGVVARPSVELVAASGDRVYVVAPQGIEEGLFTVASGATQLVAILPLTAPDSLGQGQFPQAAFDLLIDGPNAVGFVSLIGHAPFPSKVLSVALDTGNVTTLSSMPLSLPGSTLALDSKSVYYASSFGQGAPAIFAVDRAGGATPNAVVPTPTYCASCARAIVAASHGGSPSIYFSSGEFGQNVSSWSPAEGGDPTLVYETQINAAVTGIRSDGACVYWVVAGDPNVYVAPVSE